MIGLVAFVIALRQVPHANPLSITDPDLGALAAILESLAFVMLLLWVGALVRLARQHDWGWFLAVLALHLAGLGIVGMAAYAVAGPVDVDLSRPGIT